MLSIIMQQLYSSVRSEPAAAAAQQGLLSRQRAKRQQLTAALLAELMPSVVSALVQAAETAAAGARLHRAWLLWGASARVPSLAQIAAASGLYLIHH